MSLILITYDLNRPGQDYKDLHETIKALGTWWHFLDSTWIVKCYLAPSQVWEKLSTVTDANDSFLILDVTADSRAGWLPEDAWDWLNAA